MITDRRSVAIKFFPVVTFAVVLKAAQIEWEETGGALQAWNPAGEGDVPAIERLGAAGTPREPVNSTRSQSVSLFSFGCQFWING